ncbi:MAG: TonB-dependent siderophore receptor, partial [Cyanobacteria bacterium J06626_14]
QPQESTNDVAPRITPYRFFVTHHLSPITHYYQPTSSSIAQAESALIQITNVQLETTAMGLQILLETDAGELVVPTQTVAGNALITEIPNAVLVLPEGDEFQQFEPAAGIALVQVTGLPDDRVQVVITGVDAVPTAEVSTASTQLTLSVMPGGAPAGEADDPLRIIVTGELAAEDAYRVPNATTGTRTETPILDVPQAIQVVPAEVLEDQAATDLQDALRNVSGITQGNTTGNTEDEFAIRGFSRVTILQDGFRSIEGNLRETANLERIEVLQGPASVLFGSGQPGGVINLVTEKPLSEPFYEFLVRGGTQGFFRPELDISGPIGEDGEVLYRLNAVYESAEGFRDFDQNIERIFIAPVLSVEVDPRTDLIFEFEYLNDERPFDRGLVALGDGVADIPLDRVLGEPDDFFDNEEYRLRYRLEHRFSDNWTLRNAVQYASSDSFNVRAEPDELDESTGILSRFFNSNDIFEETYAVQTQVEGNFNTGSIVHKLLLGFDFANESSETLTRASLAPPINIFDPEYEITPRPDLADFVTTLDQESERTSWGFYLQDQIDLTDELILVLGGRMDIVDQTIDQTSLFLGDLDLSGQETAFSPRVGLVYQPVETVSLYASFSRSFQPNTFFNVTSDGEFVDFERGTQYEVGVKADWFDGRLSSTLALFDITRTNVAAPDPDAPPGSGFVIPIGEERSRGIGLDIAGEILPGWNIIASYSYIDAEITDSNELGAPEGNRVANVPRNSASLWTTYEIQAGALEGLGFGLGFLYESDREGDPANTFELPSYFRTDAAVFYERDNWRAALNIQNLFDIDYFESTGNTRLRANPGEPLTILGTLAVEF